MALPPSQRERLDEKARILSINRPQVGRRQNAGATSEQTVHDEATVATSNWGIQSSHRPLALPLLSNFLDSFEGAGNGLEALDQASKRQADGCLGRRAPSKCIIGPDDALPFDSTAVAAARKASLSCWERHPGLCREDPDFRRAHRLGFNLMRGVRSCVPRSDVGTGLFFAPRGRDVPGGGVLGDFLWCAWMLERPFQMVFVSAIATGEVHMRRGVISFHPPQFQVTLQAPLQCFTHFEVAARMLTRHGVADPMLYKIAFTDVSISTVKVDSVVQSLRLSAVAAQTWTPKADEYEVALEALSSTRAQSGVSKGKRRARGKKAEDEEEEGAPSSQEEEEEEDSDHCIGMKDPPGGKPPSGPSVVKPPTSSVFFRPDQLGISDLHMAPTGRSSCAICSTTIKKGTVRATYAYDVKKPHRYIHSACVSLLDGEFGVRALDTIRDILSNEALDAEILTVAKKK